jgi:general secretion pathway protein I
LIEVLVALAIVTIGMAAVLESLSSAANTISYLRDETLAEWVGLNQVATTRLNLQPGQVPMTGNTQGEIDYAGRSWHWRQEVIETQVKGMVRIDVKVRPAEVKAGDDNGWYVTVSGIAGDALAPMQGTTPLWSNGTGLQGSGNCPPGQLDCNPTPNCQPGQANCNPTPNSCAAGSLGCNNQNSGGNTSNSGGLGGNTNSTGGLGGGSNGRNPPPTPQNQGAGP